MRENAHRRPSPRALAALAVAVVLLLASSCPESPISESLEIRFEPDGSATVVTRVALRRGENDSNAEAERVERWARDLENRDDPWSRRIVRLAPPRDVETVEREAGRIAAVRREARSIPRGSLDVLFEGTSVAVRYDEGEGWAEVAFVAGASGPAPASEVRRTTRELEAWSEKVAAYVRAEHELFRHLEANPSRADACIRALFDEKEPTPLEPAEQVMVDAIGERYQEVWGVRTLSGDAGDTLEERARRAFDPFPAPVSVRVDGDVVEREGFVDGTDGALLVPSIGAWNAFLSLEGRWVEPDVLAALWRHDERSDEDYKADEFLKLQRRVSTTAPTPAEVATAIRGSLRPESVYRVRWERKTGEGSPATGNIGSTALSGASPR